MIEIGMTKCSKLLCIALGMGLVPCNVLGEETAPPFPKIGSEYRFTPSSSEGLELPFTTTREILILDWLGGAWYKVAFRSPADQMIHTTNVNISQLLALTERAKDELWIKSALAVQQQAEQLDVSIKFSDVPTRPVQSGLVGTWLSQLVDESGQKWVISTTYREDGTFSSSTELEVADRIRRPESDGATEPITAEGKWELLENRFITLITKSSDSSLVGKLTPVKIQELSDRLLQYESEDGRVYSEFRQKQR